MAPRVRFPSKAEIITKKTRRALQEYFVGTTLRTISQAFDDADVACDSKFVSTDSGQRRGLVQQYYASLDFSKWEDVRKFLAVYADAMVSLQNHIGGYNAESAQSTFARLNDYIRRDGFDFRDGHLAAVGTLPAAAKLKEDAMRVDAPYLLQQIERIENQIETDPRLAIGTSKELVETVCKTILTDRGVAFDRKWELSDLVKCTRGELNLVPEDVPDSAKAADTIRRLLGNLGSITQSLAELRNAYGTGHGHDGRAKGLSPRHARLAAGAACTLAKFLFETHQHRSD
jgi:abortive infection Abi-like protein